MNKYFWIIYLIMGLMGADIVSGNDTDSFGASTPTIKPNVMIIFDTSGSMDTKDIPEAPYDENKDYSAGGRYEKDTVYGWRHDHTGGSWFKLITRNALDVSCINANIDDALDGNGQTWSRINAAAPHNCGETYDEIELRMGNFLNYENGGYAGLMRKRLDVAKAVVKQLIEDHPDVRFGLMRFAQAGDRPNGDTRGGVLTKHGDVNINPTADQLKADIDTFSADSDSPLAETLAEAGLYFAGQTSWYNNIKYTSPIDIKCRPNAIILMTDGESTKDQDNRLIQRNAYIGNGTIGDYDGDGNDPGAYDRGGTDFLDDVALYLYENDLMPDLGTGDPHYEKQNIMTHAIGFKKTHKLLSDTVANGGGKYFTAGSAVALTRVFEKIIHTIENSKSTFTTPKIPASLTNSAFSGNYLYLGLFKPIHNGGQWRGNLKKYKLNSYGEMVDKNNLPATGSDGGVVTSAQSYWSTMVDGAQVDLGGAGALLVNRPSRNLYTYVGGADKSLTADINSFSISNKDNIALSDLGVDNDDERKSVIKKLHGVGADWVMADVIHSEPTVVKYDTNGDKKVDQSDDALVYVGTNGGVMHAFLDSSGQELWGFIPPQQLGRLKRIGADMNHGYAIDGPPVVFNTGIGGDSKKALIFGERRGGNSYYGLDITVYDKPVWKYRIGDDVLGKSAERLGQSWGRPQFAVIATGSENTAQVLLLPGGYDPLQDADEPKKSDERGRAVFSVMADSGAVGPFKFYNDRQHPDMTHSIVDLVGVDSDGDGLVSSIYAPDLGGNMFVFSDHDKDGVWKKLRLFSASSETQMKIFFSPDVIRIMGDPYPEDQTEEEKIGEMIFFGTGDIVHPGETKSKNRFYAVKNYDWDTDFSPLSDNMDADGDGDLHDATRNPIVQGATLKMQQDAVVEIKERMGWYIDLETVGEKVASSPVVYNRTVYFTTYVPPITSGASTDDDCDTNVAKGEARLYALNFEDGRSVHIDWSDIKEIDPVTREEIRSGGKADRYIRIGRSMPSAPVMAIRDGIAMLYISVGGHLMSIMPKQAVEMNMYYWREINGTAKGKP